MRRTFILLFIMLSASVLNGQPFDPFGPANPTIMGRGGSFTATAQGYNSFFYNPAGFARKGELTITSVNAWAFMDQGMVSIAQDLVAGSLGLPLPSQAAPRAIDPDDFADLQVLFDDLATWVDDTDEGDLEAILLIATGDAVDIDPDADIADIIAQAGIEDVMDFLLAVEAAAAGIAPLPISVADIEALLATALPSGYLRAGGMLGLGYVGEGLGLGLFANTEAVVDGTNILQATGTAYNTITFVGGMGLSFGDLDVGVGIRPTVFGYSQVNAAPILASFLSGGALDFSTIFANTVYFGSGLGIDIGAVYKLGPFGIGVAVKDLFGTQISYRKSGFDEYYQALIAASLPIGAELTASEAGDAWTIPMKINMGFEFHPDLGVMTYLVDPSVSVDLLDVTSTLRTIQSGGQITGDQVLAMFNFGGQVELLRFLTVSAGYYGGYLSAGLGLSAFILDFNAAIAGDFGPDATGAWGFNNVGLSAEIAFRL